jgi:hypothetical protein
MELYVSGLPGEYFLDGKFAAFGDIEDRERDDQDSFLEYGLRLYRIDFERKDDLPEKRFP